MTFIIGFMDYMWMIQDYLISYCFIVIVQKFKRERIRKRVPDGSLAAFVKLVFWGFFPVFSVLSKFSFLFFSSKDNLIIVSDSPPKKKTMDTHL